MKTRSSLSEQSRTGSNALVSRSQRGGIFCCFAVRKTEEAEEWVGWARCGEGMLVRRARPCLRAGREQPNAAEARASCGRGGERRAGGWTGRLPCLQLAVLQVPCTSLATTECYFLLKSCSPADGVSWVSREVRKLRPYSIICPSLSLSPPFPKQTK